MTFISFMWCFKVLLLLILIEVKFNNKFYLLSNFLSLQEILLLSTFWVFTVNLRLMQGLNCIHKNGLFFFQIMKRNVNFAFFSIFILLVKNRKDKSIYLCTNLIIFDGVMNIARSWDLITKDDHHYGV